MNLNLLYAQSHRQCGGAGPSKGVLARIIKLLPMRAASFELLAA